MSRLPLSGNELLGTMIRLAHLPRTQVAIECGYYTLTRTEDGELVSEADLESFYEAVLTAKGIFSQRTIAN